MYGGCGVAVVEGINFGSANYKKKFKERLKMKYINVIDAKEQFSYLVNLLTNPQEEVFLTFGGKHMTDSIYKI